MRGLLLLQIADQFFLLDDFSRKSVQRQLADSKRREEFERSHALQCKAIPTKGLDRSRTIAVLSLRVGTDGRALGAEIDRSSGQANLDKMLLRCARTWGPFPIAIVDGRIVESWQSVEWPAPNIKPSESPETAN